MEAYRARRQEEIYRRLFARIASLLPDRGRFDLQTMVFGRNMIALDRIDINAPRDSAAYYLALMGCQFPGSFLPFGQEQIIRSARSHFRLVSSTAAGSTTSRPSPSGERGLPHQAPERRCSSCSCFPAG